MNVDGGVLQAFETTTVEEKKMEFVNLEVNEELNSIVVFKKSVKYIRNINVFFKRVIDILGALIGITILIPLTVIIKIANVLNKDYGPIFYSQERIGLYGKTFKMYKFRSMVIGAEEKLKQLLEKDEEAREEYMIYKKLKDDPRITAIGKVLRKTSLDEFPQFINVLKGEMSLVGPRAYLPIEKADMKEKYSIIILHKPGITGLWQVSGRSDVSFEERLNMDIEYHKRNNLLVDFSLLLKTFSAVIKKNGAE